MHLHPLTVNDRDTWNNSLALLPYAHVLQTWEWGEFKAKTTGWQPARIAYMHQGEAAAMAQILTRQEGPFKIMYVPKGPAMDYTNRQLRQAVLKLLKKYAEDHGAIFIKIDPDVVTGWGEPGTDEDRQDPLGQAVRAEWQEVGFVFSPDQIQFRNSVVIDLRPDEETLLANMKQKTRYNVRLASRRSIEARLGSSSDFDLLYDLYKETALRDDFIIRPDEYYHKAWNDFMKAGLAQPIIAEFKGDPIAHVIVFGFARHAWYFYGASSDEERNRMPTYLLQWEAMKWAKEQKMVVYDMWGAPDDFQDEDDPLAGVYRFKSGFGGIVSRRIGAWDYPARPRLYKAYTQLMPAVLNIMRRVARR